MNATPHDGRTHPHEQHDEPDPRDESREGERHGGAHRDPRTSRLGAAQLAAPSTRRWRRAGRFDSPS